MNNHDYATPFAGSILALASFIATPSDIETWLKISSLAVGTLAGILGCISAIHNLRK